MLDLQNYSSKEIIENAGVANTPLGIRAYSYIEHNTLPDNELIFELLEAFLKRKQTVVKGLLFNGFPDKLKNLKHLQALHHTYNHSLYIVQIKESIQQIYERLLDVTDEHVKTNPRYISIMKKKSAQAGQVIAERLLYLKSFEPFLVIDDALPEATKILKIREFFSK